jgi:hypothetical protein
MSEDDCDSYDCKQGFRIVRIKPEELAPVEQDRDKTEEGSGKVKVVVDTMNKVEDEKSSEDMKIAEDKGKDVVKEIIKEEIKAGAPPRLSAKEPDYGIQPSFSSQGQYAVQTLGAEHLGGGQARGTGSTLPVGSAGGARTRPDLTGVQPPSGVGAPPRYRIGNTYQQMTVKIKLNPRQS